MAFSLISTSSRSLDLNLDLGHLRKPWRPDSRSRSVPDQVTAQLSKGKIRSFLNTMLALKTRPGPSAVLYTELIGDFLSLPLLGERGMLRI